MFPVDDGWSPVFPTPEPLHWVAFVDTGSRVALRSDIDLDAPARRWLASWLAKHEAREPDLDASYIYVGLGHEWAVSDPDGRTTDHGVTGVGSGLGFGEPAGAVTSRVSSILERAIVALANVEDPGGPRV